MTQTQVAEQTRKEAKHERRAAKRLGGVMPGAGTVARSAKDASSRRLRVTVFPEAGGVPYEDDVELDDDGNFDIGNTSYQVERGSVWLGRDGLMRAIAKEGQSRTVNAAMIEGDSIMHPKVYHANIHRTVLGDFASVARSRGVWRQAGTWGLFGLGVGVLLCLVWLVQSVGGGLEEIRNALDSIQVQAPAAAPRTPAEQAGHNPIAPGGG